MGALARRKYLIFLVAVGAVLVVYPALRGTPGARFVAYVMVTVIFLSALLVVFKERMLRFIAIPLAIVTVAGVWTGYTIPGLPETPLYVAFHLVAAVFLLFVLATVLISIHRAKTVSADGIYGAFCGYLLIGVTFSHLFCVTESATPGSFVGNEEVGRRIADRHERYFLLTYFSMSTITTLGYGDIMPGTDVARGLAVVEALTGQFYIAVLIAELIGKRVSQTIASLPGDEREGGKS